MPFTLRPATADDHAAFLRLFAELRIPDPAPLPATFAERFTPNMTVACAGDDVIGYTRWRRYGTTAHVIHVVTDPAWRGKRVGQLLLEALRASARDAGCTRWYLNVKKENTSALRLYERCGFAIEMDCWSLRMPWTSALDLPAATDVATRLAVIEEDAAIATRFGWNIERVESIRGHLRATMIVGTTSETSETSETGETGETGTTGATSETSATSAIDAFAAFLPGYPGAAPIATARPGLAGVLLRACHAYARPEHDYTRLHVEGNHALYEELVAGGAETAFSLWQMSSEI